MFTFNNIWFLIIITVDSNFIQLDDSPTKEDFVLFYTKSSAINLFKTRKIWPLTETWNLLQDYKSRCFEGFIKPPRASFKRHRIIVIDSNNKTHRNIIAKKLAKRLNGKVIFNPPECLDEYKDIYGENNPLHRAFDVLGMYAAAHTVKLNYRERPVVLSGYWNYAAALGLDEIYPNEYLPEDSALLKFPKDLLLPDITIFVHMKKYFPTYKADAFLKKKNTPRWKTILKKMQEKDHKIVIINSCLGDVNIVSEIEQNIELEVSPQILVKKRKTPWF